MTQYVAVFLFVVTFFASCPAMGEDIKIIQDSVVALQNNTEESATVNATVIDILSLQEKHFSTTIPKGRALFIDGGMFGMPPNSYGSMQVQSDQPLVGFVLHKNTNDQGDNLGQCATGLSSSDEVDFKLHIPFTSNSNDSKSYITVQNTGATNTDVTVEYFMDGLTSTVKKLGLSPGATHVFEPQNKKNATAVVTSDKTKIAADVYGHPIWEELAPRIGFCYGYSGKSEKNASTQRLQPFIYKNLDGLNSSLVGMNISAQPADGVGMFKEHPLDEWESQDISGVLPNYGVMVTPKIDTTWKAGLGLLSFPAKHAAITLNSKDDQTVSYATGTFSSPVELASEWYGPVTNDTIWFFYHDSSMPREFTLSLGYGETELSTNFTLGAWEKASFTFHLPLNIAGAATVESLHAVPTGLALVSKLKVPVGDFGAYSVAHSASKNLYLPWFAYKHESLFRKKTPLLFMITPVLINGRDISE